MKIRNLSTDLKYSSLTIHNLHISAVHVPAALVTARTWCDRVSVAPALVH